MGTHEKEGKNLLLHTIGKDPKRLIEEKMENDGKPGTHTDEDTQDETFSAGRSVALKNYEYAKVTMGMKVGLPVGADKKARDAAQSRMTNAVTEILDREEAVIRGEDRKFTPIDLNGIGVKVSIWIDYSLTFKGEGRDFHSLSISSSRFLSDGSDFEAQIDELQMEVGARIGAEKEKTLGTDGDVGF